MPSGRQAFAPRDCRICEGKVHYTMHCTVLHCILHFAPHPTALHYITLHYTTRKRLDFGSYSLKCACSPDERASLRGAGNPRIVSQRLGLGVENANDHIDSQFGYLRAKSVVGVTDLCKLSVSQRSTSSRLVFARRPPF